MALELCRAICTHDWLIVARKLISEHDGRNGGVRSVQEGFSWFISRKLATCRPAVEYNRWDGVLNSVQGLCRVDETMMADSWMALDTLGQCVAIRDLVSVHSSENALGDVHNGDLC